MNLKSLFITITASSGLLLSTQAPAVSWTDAKEQIKKAAYYVTPASWNPHDFFYDNYHKVVDGVYRSKTMSPSSLEKYITQDNINTILILREDGLNNYWRTAEKTVADAHNIEMITEILNARVLPAKDKLQRIYAVLKQCKDEGKNLLIHCVAGVDRTGQISALRLLMEENTTIDQALNQLTTSYGHHKWRFPHCSETVKQLAEIMKARSCTLEEAIEHFPLREFNPPSLPVRAFTALKDTAVDAVKNNPKTAVALAFATAAGIGAAYAHRKGKLVPALKSVKEKIFGK